MVLVPLLAGPLLISVALAARRRLGPAAAGAVGALPVSIGVAVAGLSASLGRDAAATLALTAAAHVAAQVAFLVVFATRLRRGHRFLAALAGGTAVFAGASLLLAGLPAPAAVALAGPALVAGIRRAGALRLLPPQPSPSPVPARASAAVETAAAAAAVVAVVGAILLCAHLAGPSAAGVVGAFPALTSVLAWIVLRHGGPAAGAAALGGAVHGLVAYFVFCAALAVALPRLGIVAALALAVMACLAAAATRVRGARRVAGPRRAGRIEPRGARPFGVAPG